MSVKSQLAQTVEALPESVTIEEAIARIYQAFRLKQERATATPASVAEGVAEPAALSADMAEAISALHLLDDGALWRAARSQLAPERSAAIEDLHLRRQADGLAASDAEELERLMREYTRTLLVRSKAAALLKERGHDVSVQLSPS